MVGTKAKWFRDPGAKPVYEPQRPGRQYPRRNDERRRYPLPGSDPGDRRFPQREPDRPFDPNRRPEREPGFDPRFKPKERERTPRPISPRPVPKPAPGAGRVRLPRIPGLRVPIDPLDFPGLVSPFVSNPDPAILPKLPPNYQWCRGPVAFPGVYRLGWRSAPWFTDGGNCTLGVPIDGQVTSHPGKDLAYGIRLGASSCYWWRNYQHSGAFIRGYNAGTIVRTHTLNPQPLPYRIAVPRWTISDPNVDRWLPSSPDPFPPYIPGYSAPAVTPEPVNNPELPYQPDYAWQWDPAFGLSPIPGGAVQPVPGVSWGYASGRPSSPDPPVKPIPPVTRDPPPKGEKQRKVLTKSARIGIALYRALDAASEGSEIVDALYEALPEEVRKRWKCPDNRMGDSFGQYGFANADCKARALYHNLHKLNVEQGLKNIIKNHLQDAVIGGMQAGLPVNTGAAHSHGEKEFAKRLDRWLCDELGLCDEED